MQVGVWRVRTSDHPSLCNSHRRLDSRTTIDSARHSERLGPHRALGLAYIPNSGDPRIGMKELTVSIQIDIGMPQANAARRQAALNRREVTAPKTKFQRGGWTSPEFPPRTNGNGADPALSGNGKRPRPRFTRGTAE